MTVTPKLSVKLLKEPKFWLLGIAISLTTLYLNLFRLNQTINPLAVSLIFLSAAGVLIYPKRYHLTLKSDLFSRCLGTLLITFFLFQTCYQPDAGDSVLALPLIASLALALLASGWRGLKQYWPELSILLALAIPGSNFFLWFLKLGWVNYLLKSSKTWLLCLAASLVIIYLDLFITVKGLSVLDKALIALIGILWLLWQKRDQLNIKTTLYPSLLGIACLAFVLANDSFNPLKTFPLFTLLGLGLLTAGWRIYQQYGGELIISLVLTLSAFLEKPFNEELPFLTNLTTDLTTFVLYILGYTPLREGNLLVLHADAVKALYVNYGCSGYAQITWLLLIAVIFLAMFPSSFERKIIVPATAIVIAFLCNGVRIAILTILVAAGNDTGFHYWHEGEGSQIFSIISLLIFGSFCFYLISRLQPEQVE